MKQKLIFIPVIIILIFITGCNSKPNAEVKSDIKTDTDKQLSVTYIDVGKGDCILAEYDKKSILIDTGYQETVDDVLSFLKQCNIEKIDYLVITHYDKDHVGGAADIAENIEIDKIFLPNYEDINIYYNNFMNIIHDKNLNAENVSEDVNIEYEDLKFNIKKSDIIYQEIDGDWNDNDVSLIVSLNYNDDSYLFAGDIERDGIDSYLSKESDNYDVLKMPHHGKKEKNTDDFIDSVKPEIAVITDSEDEPAKKGVLKILNKSDTEIYRSSVNGNIHITGNGKGNYDVETEY